MEKTPFFKKIISQIFSRGFLEKTVSFVKKVVCFIEILYLLILSYNITKLHFLKQSHIECLNEFCLCNLNACQGIVLSVAVQSVYC